MSTRSKRLPDVEQYYDRIENLVRRPIALMEVCGTHTMSISRHGLRARMPGFLRLISGPGCPVCVTSCEQIDQMIAMAGEPGVVIATFGDMMRVPGSVSSLDQERARGRSIHVIYSPVDALQYATKNPERTVVLMGIGFETTSPTVAATLVRAAQLGVKNFFVLPAFKRVVPAMAALVAEKETRIDGFICPGHVSAIIGSRPYETVAGTYRVPCVVTGFEAIDILEGVSMLLEQINEDRFDVEVAYSRAVPWDGNPAALELMARVFCPCDAVWRGIGVIPDSGLELSDEFSPFDARSRVPVDVPSAPDLSDGCSCGEVMKGLKIPTECPLFGMACTPARPVGPCMVSSEGACAAFMRYGG